MTGKSLYEHFLEESPDGRICLDHLTSAHNMSRRLLRKGAKDTRTVFYEVVSRLFPDQIKRLMARFEDQHLEEAYMLELAEHLQSSQAVASSIEVYHQLKAKVPLSDSENQEVMNALSRRVYESLTEEQREKYPLHVVEKAIYRMPSLNLGPTTVQAMSGSAYNAESITYTLDLLLGDRSELRWTLFRRVFMKEFDRFRSPEEALEFLDYLNGGKGNER